MYKTWNFPAGRLQSKFTYSHAFNTPSTRHRRIFAFRALPRSAPRFLTHLSPTPTRYPLSSSPQISQALGPPPSSSKGARQSRHGAHATRACVRRDEVEKELSVAREDLRVAAVTTSKRTLHTHDFSLWGNSPDTTSVAKRARVERVGFSLAPPRSLSMAKTLSLFGAQSRATSFERRTAAAETVLVMTQSLVTTYRVAHTR